MADYGFCPSGRLFEAASCGTPLLSDTWPGLDTFLTPGEEIILVETSEDVVLALNMQEEERQYIAQNARARVLREHTADARAETLENLLASLRTSAPVLAGGS